MPSTGLRSYILVALDHTLRDLICRHNVEYISHFLNRKGNHCEVNYGSYLLRKIRELRVELP